MKSIVRLSLCCLCTFAFASIAVGQDDGFVPLFDGKTLDGWKSARSTGEGDWGPFSVNEEEQAIHVYAGAEAGSKQKTDCLNSDTQYSHFVLQLEYKWGENRFEPRPDWDRDSGLLFHVHGDLTRVWPFCLEMQIGESAGDKPDARGSEGRFHTGDLFVLRKDLRTSTTIGENKRYSADGKLKVGRSVRTPLGVEKPKGEWNAIEIRVQGSEKATFIFNGETVLETSDFHFKDADGNKVSLERGHIGLQAEWAELMYRNIRIKDLSPKVCQTRIKEIRDNCIAYKLNVGSYPQSLNDLATRPEGMTEGEWGGPYLRGGKLPKDPWGKDFIYSADETTDRISVSSNGPDGVTGTPDDIPARENQ